MQHESTMSLGGFGRGVSWLCLLMLGACGSEELIFSGAAPSTPQPDAPLPNWATEEEIELARSSELRVPRAATAAPQGAFRLPAEYEPTEAVLMTWAGYTSMLSSIAAAAASADAQVWVVGGPSTLAGVPSDAYRQLGFAYDSVWVRDYGPFGINEETHELGIVDTTYRHYAYRRRDDVIPCSLAESIGAPCYRTQLILDGGNLMSDGKGTLFTTTRTYEWNDHLGEDQVDELLRNYFGVHTIHALDYAGSSAGWPADGTGHIDMFAKILDECVVLVAQAREEPYRTPLEEAASFFANLECAPGRSYEVHRIRGWDDWGTWYTYTNSLIVNDHVLVPSYYGADDEAARQAYELARPDLKVDFIASDESIGAGGSIHCVTREIPVVEAPMPENRAPVAEAGEDIEARVDDTITLDGTDSYDPDGDPLSYLWEQVEGPTVGLRGSDTATPRLVLPELGEETRLRFSLVVSDGAASSEPDEVSVLIETAPQPNAAHPLITELMVNPDCVSDYDGEWIEIFNPAEDTVSLEDWRLESDACGSLTLSGLEVGAGETLVFCSNDDPADNGGIICDSRLPWGFYVGNRGDRLRLISPEEESVDSVAWGEGELVETPRGASLERLESGELIVATEPIVGGCGDLGTPGLVLW